jgi:AcrR family transcriptional regulator
VRISCGAAAGCRIVARMARILDEMAAEPSPRNDGAGEHATSAAIREAALRLFARDGYQVTSMRALADEVGVRPSAIYNHYGSKQELLYEIVRGNIQQTIAGARAGVAASDDVAEQLRAAVKYHVAFHAGKRLQMYIAERETARLEEPARSRQIGYRREYVAIFIDVIERGRASGRFTTPDSRISAFAILQMGLGVSTWYHDEGELSPDELGDLYGEFAVRMLTA